MLALGFNGPWDISISERPEPEVGPTDVLIKVIATGVCGSDVHGYSGDTGRRFDGQIMGHETVGRVAQCGNDVTEVEPGTLVTVNPLIPCNDCASCAEGESQVCPNQKVIGVEPLLDGAFAEYFVAPANNVVPISESIPVMHGALIEPLAVGYHAARRGAVTPEDRLLVIGGGPIGQAVAIGARRLGATEILVSEPSDSRRQLLEQLGFTTTTPDDLAASVHHSLGGTATVVIDAVGVDASMASALEYSATRGRIVLVGMGSKTMTIAPYAISIGERELLGSYCYSDVHFRGTAAWVSEGHPELDLLIDKELPLEDGPEVFRTLADGSVSANKILLVPNMRQTATE
jgi:threonine dehydrogenase-like Zn-dependent dehydrogenase